MTKEDVLKQSRVSGNTVFLPAMQLDRKLYVEVNKALELIGGKWDRKTKGHVFPHDPTELLEEITTGTTRNLKKEYQYFPTPDDLADKLVRLADIEPGNTILEPSAGQGAIIKAIHRSHPGVIVHAYELMPINQTFLKKLRDVMFMGADFLESPKSEKFDRIIANPPFSKNQDIEHFRVMYERLKPGGKLVSVMSPHWEFAGDRKSAEFREWLKELPEPVEQRPIPRGTFKESGTDVHGFILSVTKPAEAQPVITTTTEQKTMSTRERFEQLRILYIQNLIAGKYDEKHSIILNAIFTELENRVAEGEARSVVSSRTEPPTEETETTPEPETEVMESGVVMFPMSRLKTDESRFQPRDMKEEIIADIAQNYNPHLFGPLNIWNDPQNGETYVLAGHHRYYGAKRRGMEYVPVKFFKGTEEQARELAAIENAKRTEQTAIDNAKILRRKRIEGAKEKDIKQFCEDSYGKNCLDAYRISLLYDDGKAMQYARELRNSKESTKAMLDMLTWIGRLKDENDYDLTKTQENELFEHLWENYRHGRAYKFFSDFERKVKKVTERVFELGINTGASLNFGVWEDTSSTSAQVFDEQTKVLEKELKKARDRFEDEVSKAAEQMNDGASIERIDAVLKKYQDAVLLAEKELLKHKTKEFDTKHIGKETEMALFGLGDKNGLQDMKDYDADSDSYSNSTALVSRSAAAILQPEEITSEAANSAGFWRPADVQKTEISPLLLLRTKPLLHSLNSPFEMLLWGKYGGGKSTLALFLADDLARNAETLYLLTEEKIKTGRLNRRLQRIGLDPDITYADNLDFTGLWMLLDENPIIKNIIIDSISKFTIGGRAVSNEDLNKLKDGFPDRNFVFIVHATKQGETFRGFHNLAHDVDTVVKVEDGIAVTTKHRDGPQGMPFSIMVRQPERAVFGKLTIA